jgi:hypothetical protein
VKTMEKIHSFGIGEAEHLMKLAYFFFIIPFSLVMSVSAAKAQSDHGFIPVNDYQVLMNGRLWSNEHAGIKGDPFLFTGEFLPGSVYIGDKDFHGLSIRYDIFSDQIMIPFEKGILELNKELIDSFSLFVYNKLLRFVRLPENNLYGLSGYVQNLYSERSALYIKYRKKIDRPGMVNAPDNFYQLQRMYYIHNNVAYAIKSKRDLLRIFREDKELIGSFINKDRIHVRRSNPESFVPLVRYIDSIVK